MPLQLRRGLEADRTTFTPAEGEPIFTTDQHKLFVGDGATAGGLSIASMFNLSELSDLNIAAIGAGEILKWDGSNWVNNTLAEAGIAAASHTHAAGDITSGTFADARIAASNVTQHVTKAYVDGLAVDAGTLDGIDSTGFATSGHTHAGTEITSGAASSGDVLTADGAGGASFQTLGGGSLSSLSDTTITSVNAGELLGWDGAAWINKTPAEAGLASVGHNHNLSALADTSISSIGGGEVLVWNGISWLNRTLTEAGIAPASHTHAAGDVTSGTFADDRISASSVQQHVTKTLVDGLGVDASTLDGVDSVNFLRSDAVNDMTAPLTLKSFNAGNFIEFDRTAVTGVDILWGFEPTYSGADNKLRLYSRAPGSSTTSTLFEFVYDGITTPRLVIAGTNTVWHGGNDGASSGLDADLLDGYHASSFLLSTGKAADSNLLDGIDSSAFLRSNTNDSFTGSTLTINNTLTVSGTLVIPVVT